jgi:hypothetical protein
MLVVLVWPEWPERSTWLWLVEREEIVVELVVLELVELVDELELVEQAARPRTRATRKFMTDSFVRTATARAVRLSLVHALSHGRAEVEAVSGQLSAVSAPRSS